MSVTIKDIAKEAKVSYATVSRALADQPGINRDTRKRIKALAKEMNYTPNAIAKGLVTNSTFTIGFVVPDITNPFFSEVALGFEEYASKHGYQVFLCNTNWDLDKEKEYLKKLSGNRVDGIAIGPASDEVSHIVELDQTIPVVFAAYRPPIENCSYVVTDDFKSAVLAVEYLIKIGHTQIAFIGGKINSSTNIDRLCGYKEALKKHNIPIDEELIMHGEYRRTSGYKLTKELLINMDTPTAILAGDDIIALGVIQAIEEFGLSVPKNVSVMGFDDISYASLDKIQLSTIYQPKHDLGEMCAKIILERIKNPDELKNSYKVLEPTLSIRKTCTGI